MNRILPNILSLSLLTFGSACAQEEEPTLDVPYVPTPPEVVDAMLDLAEIQDGDVVWDLGCGDGRLIVGAAKRADIRGVGVDIDPERIAESKKNAAEAGVEDEVSFRVADLFETDFSDATVLTMYLLGRVNLDLRPKILELKPGTRVVSNTFDMDDWEPDETREVNGTFNRTIYFWRVPANVSGDWTWEMEGDKGTLSIEQTFQKLSGTFTFNGKEHPILNGVVKGDEVTFFIKVPERERQVYTAKAEGDTLMGSIEDETWKATRQAGTKQPLDEKKEE